MTVAESERLKICYEQNCLTFRSLNQLMWSVPLIAMTLTGGLWFGVAKVSALELQAALLLLALGGNAGLAIVLRRLRYVMGEYLAKMKIFAGDAHVEAPGNQKKWFTGAETVVWCFMLVLLLSAGLSLAGLIWSVAMGGQLNPE